MLFGRVFAKLEDLGVVHVGDQIFRFFAELVDLLRLAQVLKEGFLVLVALELFDQLLDLVLAMLYPAARLSESGIAKNYVVNSVVRSFPVTLRFTRWVPR